MNKESINKEFLFKEYVEKRKTYAMLAKELNISKEFLYKKLKEYGIHIRNPREAKLPKEAIISSDSKWCPVCKTNKPLKDFNKSKHRYLGVDIRCRACASKQSSEKFKRLKKCRPISKAELVFEFGDKCAICGDIGLPLVCYCFHHMDSLKKELAIGHALTLKKHRTIKEAKEKCKMVCFNCHCVIHHGTRTAIECLKKELPLCTRIKKANRKYTFHYNRNIPNNIKIKRCHSCGKYKLLDLFHHSKKGQLERTSYCKECVASHEKENKNYRREKHTRDKAKLVMEFGNKCFMCGAENLPLCCYAFHHNNPEEKEVSFRNASFSSITTIEEVRSKCILLCQNCHEVAHHGGTTVKDILSEKNSLTTFIRGYTV